MAKDPNDWVPIDTPDTVKERVVKGARVPEFDPTVGVPSPPTGEGIPPHRLVVIGDSLSQGFQSGAIFNTDDSYAAIIAYELGWLDSLHYPRYQGPGGLPLNLELLCRELEQGFGPKVNIWETPRALFRIRQFTDEVEDYWERGPGSRGPALNAHNHVLAVYGWDIRDALSKTAASCEAELEEPNDDVISQTVQNNSERAALRVYPHWSEETRAMTMFDAAAALGTDHDESIECGIETLVIFLGANNALRSVTALDVKWSGPDFRDVKRKNAYTAWRPEHFEAELREAAAAVRGINARHVIWCTVPHVTIAPIARGVGKKVMPGSRYFPYYTRPWIDDADFNPEQDKHITGHEARAVDGAIDTYNDAIQQLVKDARSGADGTKRDWFLLDVAGLLDRLASRRFIDDPNARPSWWTPFPLPPELKAMNPVPDSRFLTGDGKGGRATGGLFSLDGVHPTTVGYGLIAQEMINIMSQAGVEFRTNARTTRAAPILVDFARLVRHDSLIDTPPQNINETLDLIGWADETIDLVKRTLSLKI